MTTNKSRLSKLEKQSGTGEKKKYFCVIGLGFGDTSEEKAKGYKVQPCAVEFGGTGGDPFYFSTRKELDEFEARRDVELILLEIVAAGSEDEKQETPSG